MDVLGHDYVSEDAKLKAAADALQGELESLFRCGGSERWTMMVAAECHKMTLAGLVESF
jgi:hypothetical protein